MVALATEEAGFCKGGLVVQVAGEDRRKRPSWAPAGRGGLSSEGGDRSGAGGRRRLTARGGPHVEGHHLRLPYRAIAALLVEVGHCHREGASGGDDDLRHCRPALGGGGGAPPQVVAPRRRSA